MIKLKNIKKEYNFDDGGKLVALNSINLVFKNCEFVCIKGTSGSGKTTLLNIVSKLLNYDAGKIESDFDFDSFSNVFQNKNLVEYLTIKELLYSIAKSYKFSTNKVMEYIIYFELYEVFNKYPQEISVGQRQLVCVIITLIQDKLIMILDEPTSSLDYNSAIKVIDKLKELSKTKLVIVSTHTQLFDDCADRIIKLEKGNVVEDALINNTCNKLIKDEDNCVNFHPLNKRISKQIFKDNKLFHISFILIMMLIMIFISISFNLAFTSKATIVSENHDEFNSIDFLKGEEFNTLTLKEEDYTFLNENDIQYVKTVYIEDENYEKIYLDSFMFNIIEGRLDYSDNEVIISKSVANIYLIEKGISKYSELINMEIEILNNGLKVVGIYDDEYYKDSIAMTCKTYESCIYFTKFSLQLDVNELSSELIYFSTIKEEQLLFGDNLSLLENEIGINNKLASFLSDDLSSLIGKEIVFKYKENDDTFHYKYKIKYIYETQSITKIVKLNETTYNQLFYKHSGNVNSNLYGASIYNYDKTDLDTLLMNNFVVFSFFKDDIFMAFFINDLVKYLSLGVGVVLILMLFLIVIKNVKSITCDNYSAIGLLNTLGISKQKATFVILKPLIYSMLPIVIFQTILNILLVDLINKILMNNLDVNLDIIYNNLLTHILVIAFSLFFVSFIYYITYKKIQKEDAVKLIKKRV